MPNFKIITNVYEIPLNRAWVNSPNFKSFKSKGREVDAQGRRVNSDYQGLRYTVIAKQERVFSFLERIERIFQGIWAVISTWGQALRSKTTMHLFTKSKETIHFCVKDNYSELPPELHIKIFNMLPVKDLPMISQICKGFKQNVETHLNLNPHDRLFFKNIKPREFTQQNPIGNFLIHNPSENPPKLVITCDSNTEYAEKNPTVKSWAIDTSSAIETNRESILSSLTLPMDYLAIGGKSSQYLAACTAWSTGLTQIWDLDAQKVLVAERKFGGTCPSSLYAMEDHLWIGLNTGNVGCFNFSDLSDIRVFKPHNHSVRWISEDPAIGRIFTKGLDGNNINNDSLKIWDDQNSLIKKIPNACIDQETIYDSQLKLLIGVNHDQNISIWKGEDGTEIHNFIISDNSSPHEATGLHFNAEQGLLFASFLINDANENALMSTIAVWNIHTKQLVNNFSTYNPEYDCYDVTTHIDFDPASGLILTGGNKVNLWNLYDGKLVKTLSIANDNEEDKDILKSKRFYPKKHSPISIFNMYSKIDTTNEIQKIIWDKKNHKLFCLRNNKLYLLDYSTQ